MTTTADVEKAIARLEREGIQLSTYGNHNSKGAILKPDAYHKLKNENSLFSSLEVIDRIRRNVREAFVFQPKWSTSTSYGLKHDVERWREEHDHDEALGDYLTNGDFIIAMILEGYEYKFRTRVNAKASAPSDVNCQFKCKYIGPVDS